MLVLSRKRQEAVVVIGTGGVESVLTITILEIEGGRVRLGFDGGSDIPVHRAEVWQRIVSDRRRDRKPSERDVP